MRIALLGSTGIIGTKVLNVIRAHPDAFSLTALAAGHRVDALLATAHEFHAPFVMAADTDALHNALDALPDPRPTQLRDTDELCSLIASPQVDMLVCAASGTSGLKPVITALEHGKKVALASKEILVLAGRAVKEAEQRGGGHLLLPIDSEHCAIFQCLEHQPHRFVRRLLLTASGGPFRHRPLADFETITASEALRHPVWNMGAKITIDSASMMNKALEVIEAHWLFEVPEPAIEVIIHPQAIVHSMVEFVDASVLAQLACPDMTLPIQFCLFHPERQPALCPHLDFTVAHTLTFEPPDHAKFPALDLARHVLRHPDQPLGAVFNAANEVAVDAFLAGRLSFAGITRLVAHTLDACSDLRGTALADALHADAHARALAADALDKLVPPRFARRNSVDYVDLIEKIEKIE